MSRTATPERVGELERAIIDAHERGDASTLSRLQAEYRTVAPVTRISSAPIRLVEGSGAQRSRPTSRPAILDTPPGISGRSAGAPTVVLTAGVQDDFSDFNDELSDGREAAGGLYGQVVGDEILVQRATLIRNQLRLRGTVHVDNWQLDDMAEHFGRIGLGLLGDWHSHVDPGPASKTDQRAWATAARRRAPWVGVIIDRPAHDWCRGDDDWTKAQYRVYLTNETGSETARAIIET